MQNTVGEDGGQNFVRTAVNMYQQYGLGVFWDGISPKCLRAALNHSVTFFVYEYIIRLFAENPAQ